MTYLYTTRVMVKTCLTKDEIPAHRKEFKDTIIMPHSIAWSQNHYQVYAPCEKRLIYIERAHFAEAERGQLTEVHFIDGEQILIADKFMDVYEVVKRSSKIFVAGTPRYTVEHT